MIRCASVMTKELDDPKAALKDIKAQLDGKIKLLKNTVGILMCHVEFLYSGVYSHIAKNLPFETCGVTNATQAVNGGADDMALTIFVITSDDSFFKVGLTESLDKEVEAPTKRAYLEASKGITETPKLAIIFPPLLLQYPGDIYPQVFSKLLPKTPNFGTLAIDDSTDFSGSETLCNGEHYKSQMAFILCYGSINPRFLVGTVPDNNVLPYAAEITRSDGAYVREINNMPAFDYFYKLGLAKSKANADNFLFMPVVIDFKKREDYDGVPVMRVLTQFDESGAAIFRGYCDENSVFRLFRFDKPSVVAKTAESVELINKMDNVNGVLSFSCIIRRMALGADTLSEAAEYQKRIKDIPYLFTYAGGEVCPTSAQGDKQSNRFHNYSLVNLII